MSGVHYYFRVEPLRRLEVVARVIAVLERHSKVVVFGDIERLQVPFSGPNLIAVGRGEVLKTEEMGDCDGMLLIIQSEMFTGQLIESLWRSPFRSFDLILWMEEK